jgi:dTDP-4-amino-4,6-dideoxygalactose transaminase
MFGLAAYATTYAEKDLNKPLSVPFLDLRAIADAMKADMTRAFERVMASGQWILGAELAAFEAAFAGYCGTRDCIGVGTGLDALKIALSALGVGAGDEVIVPGNTFIATWLAVSACGATPVACEPAPGSFNISAETVAPLITARTKAVIPVHLYGIPCRLDEIVSLARRHNLFVLEDAAQAHGAQLAGLKVGGIGHMAAFSFYPAKNLGAWGDGGAITTDDPVFAERTRKLRNYGGIDKYRHELKGTNSRLDELQAAFLSVRLEHLDGDNARRRASVRVYDMELSAESDLSLPLVPPGAEAVWHQYVIRTKRRDALRRWLETRGIGTQIHYPQAVYRTPAYAEAAPHGRTLSDELSDTVLSLPVGPELRSEVVAHVCASIREFFARTRADVLRSA